MEIVLSNPVFWSSPIFLLFILGEWLYCKLKGLHHVYSYKDFLVNSFMTTGVLLMEFVFKFGSAAAIFYFSYHLFNLEIDGVRMNFLGYESFGWAWYLWGICIFLDDFSHYWVHRWNHTIRFMWASHIVHHSSEHFNFGTSFRLNWGSKLYKPLFYAWIPAIGFHPEMLLFCYGIEMVYQFFLHTSFCPRLKFFNIVFITPKHHQVHHSKNVEYLDKNHGGIFTIFDKIFGSWRDYDESIEIEYGVTHPPNLNNPFDILTHGYIAIWRDVKSSKNFHQAFMYVFGPPGWSPDGSSLTVKQLQEQLE